MPPAREFRTRLVAVLLLGLISTAIVFTQSARGPSSDARRWRIRIDRSTSATDPDAPGPVKFVSTATGFHATNPQAAVFWNPVNTISASYSVSGTFTLLAPSNHTNYYGVVFGGADLDGPRQRYLYFLVAQDGTWLVKRRDGDDSTETLLPKTASASVRTPDASGRSINTIEARITPAALQLLINGAIVNTWIGADRVIRTDGIYGIRVNHFLDVEADRVMAAPLAASTRPLDNSAALGSETVAVTGAVRQVLSATIFVITPPNGPDVTVTARALQRAVEPKATVTVFGRRASPEEVAAAPAGSRTGSLLSAKTVLTADMVDLTKRLPPPATADDDALDGLMKEISPAFTALRAALDSASRDDALQRASMLQQTLSKVEVFWEQQSRADAVGWAHTAQRQAEAVARAAAASNWSAAKSSADVLGQQCQACHGQYRETFDDGLFRIRKRE